MDANGAALHLPETSGRSADRRKSAPIGALADRCRSPPPIPAREIPVPTSAAAVLVVLRPHSRARHPVAGVERRPSAADRTGAFVALLAPFACQPVAAEELSFAEVERGRYLATAANCYGQSSDACFNGRLRGPVSSGAAAAIMRPCSRRGFGRILFSPAVGVGRRQPLMPVLHTGALGHRVALGDDAASARSSPSSAIKHPYSV